VSDRRAGAAAGTATAWFAQTLWSIRSTVVQTSSTMEKTRPTRRMWENTMDERGIVAHERGIMLGPMSFEPSARAFLPVLLTTSLLAAGSSAPPVLPIGPSSGDQAANPRPWVTLPKNAEHRYRVKAKIRLLLFWVGRDNVGSARLTWYRGTGDDRGYEFLIGSDPARAPRNVNRWGYVSEEHRGGTATTVGVMKPANEASLEEAEANVKREGASGTAFVMIRETAQQGESVAQVTTAHVSRDYSFRDLDALLGEFAKVTRAPEVKRARFDAGATPGLLSTIVAVMHDDAVLRRQQPRSRGAQGASRHYVYNARIYTLTLASSQFIGGQEYDGRKYSNLVQNDFDITMKGFTWKEKFTVAYAMEGPDVELPVFAVYQPRWWFKVELLLDDSQVM
jgi:hypothetical protein